MGRTTEEGVGPPCPSVGAEPEGRLSGRTVWWARERAPYVRLTPARGPNCGSAGSAGFPGESSLPAPRGEPGRGPGD